MNVAAGWVYKAYERRSGLGLQGVRTLQRVGITRRMNVVVGWVYKAYERHSELGLQGV